MGIVLLAAIVALDFKGVWIPRWSITDENEIFAHLDGAFNHVFLQIFALGEARYPSQYVPYHGESDDWLIEFLDEAHRRHIKVSAWINVFYSWGYGPRTQDPNHPINKEPQWYVRDSHARSILDYDIEELKDLGIEGYYLSPGNKEVRSRIFAIIDEILSKYDFDGIHLDYVRYPESRFIYDVALRSNFMKKHYVDPYELVADSLITTRFSTWGYDDLQTRWHTFVYEDLTSFIQELSGRIRTQHPGVALSVAVKPQYLIARREYYQDWVTWLNNGLVDYVCLMAYGKHIQQYLDKSLSAVQEPHRVMVGLGLYLLSPEAISQQVDLVKSQGFAGVVFFSYDQVKKNRAYLTALK